MFEELGLAPLSPEELKVMILATNDYVRTLESLADRRERYHEIILKIPPDGGFEGLSEDEFEFVYSYDRNSERTTPIHRAASGQLDDIKYELSGWNDYISAHFNERGLVSAFNDSQFHDVAESTIRALITPDETWADALKLIGQEYELHKHMIPKEEAKRGNIEYDYHATVVAKGTYGSKVSYIESLLDSWKSGYEERRRFLEAFLECGDSIPRAAERFAMLEYVSGAINGLERVVENNGIMDGKLVLYPGERVVVFLEEVESERNPLDKDYKLKVYGIPYGDDKEGENRPAKRIVEDIMDRTSRAGLSPEATDEGLPPALETRLYDFAVV